MNCRQNPKAVGPVLHLVYHVKPGYKLGGFGPAPGPGLV